MNKGKFNPRQLLFLAACALLFLFGVEATKIIPQDPLRQYKVAAAQHMQKAMAVLKQERLRKGMAIDRQNDPNETGIIGKGYTDLTTTLGSLSSKRTSTNPNFAGLLVDMLMQAGVQKGDGAAISFSGSFPGLNIATLAAIHVSGLEPVIISSVGASTYGANEPRWTWLDMESILREKGIWPYRSQAASLGGLVETQGGLGGKGIEMAWEAIRRNNIPYLDEQGDKAFPEDRERRLALYERALGSKKPSVFINVGGTLTSLGSCPEVHTLPTGLLLHIPHSDHPRRGIIFKMNEMGVPVIHLLNIKKIAAHHGLSIDPVPLPSIPSGRVMQPPQYIRSFALAGLILLFLLALWLKESRVPTWFGNSLRQLK